MRRIIVVLTLAAVIVAMIATSGASASAQSPCPPTGPSDGPATLVIADEPVGAGFTCLDEEAQEFFCPPGFELRLFPVLPPGPDFIAECIELSPPNDGGGTGGGGSGVELTQEGEQQAEAGDIDQTTNVS
jgi:hypothetical protein